MSQHVGHHDGWEVHGLVGVGREQSVGREAVAQRVVASFVVPQVQEGRLWEVGRCYRGDLIVFVALVLAVVGLKHSKGTLSRVSDLQVRDMLDSTDNNGDNKMAPWSGSCPVPRWAQLPARRSAYQHLPSWWGQLLFTCSVFPPDLAMTAHHESIVPAHPFYRWGNYSSHHPPWKDSGSPQVSI